MSDEIQSPGELTTMGKIWEGIKHVGKKALKWGAILGGIGFLVGSTPLLGWAAELLASAPGLSAVKAFLGLESSGAIVAAAGTIIGGIFGAFTGATNVMDKVDQADADSVVKYRSAQTREMQMAAMAQQGMQKDIDLERQRQQLVAQALPARDQGVSRI